MTGTKTEDVERLATELEECWGFSLHLVSGDAADTLRALAAERDALAAKVAELRGVIHGIVDLGGTMGSALYAQTVDRACRSALALLEKGPKT